MPTDELTLGGTENNEGRLLIKNPSGATRIQMEGIPGLINARSLNAMGDSGVVASLSFNGSATIGGNGTKGHINLTTEDRKNTLSLSGATGNIMAGGNGVDGDIYLFQRNADRSDPNKTAIIQFDAQSANVRFGGNGSDGDLLIFPKGGKTDRDEDATIHLDGDNGDIILRNADCAEEFDVLDNYEPGTVVVLDDSQRLRISERQYDRRVAGVISGGGDYRPAIVLDRQPQLGRTKRSPITLVGKTYCQVDASHGAIDVGDLLTSSDVPGHAMKATDATRAFGAVLGKALKPLNSGKRLIPILVTLQ